MADKGSRHPNWAFAEQMMHRILPGSTGFDPDGIAGLTIEDWQDFEVDDRDPSTVLEELLVYCNKHIAGTLILVTMGSYLASTGPFLVEAGRLREFADEYSDLIGDPLISGDVLILSPSTGAVIVVHHSGRIATIFGKACI